MKNIIIIVFYLLLFPFYLLGQTDAPLWIDEQFRHREYPAEIWYTGFVINNISKDRQLLDALQEVENSARNKLIEQIQISIESKSELHNINYSNGQDEYLYTELAREIRTSTAATAANINVKSWYDNDNLLVYAFAYVERTQLADYWKNQEKFLLRESESKLLIADNSVLNGNKSEAFRLCKSADSLLKQASYFHRLYSATATANLPLSSYYDSLCYVVETRLLELRQSIKVFVDCTWSCPAYPDFKDKAYVVKEIVSQILTNNNCTLTDNPDNADYSLHMTASTSQRSDGSGPFGIISYYADVTGKLTNLHTGKIVTSFAILQDPRAYSAGNNTANAISKAFNSNSLKTILSEHIITGIQE